MLATARQRTAGRANCATSTSVDTLLHCTHELEVGRVVRGLVHIHRTLDELRPERVPLRRHLHPQPLMLVHRIVVSLTGEVIR